MKHILVTGAAGFIGSAFVREALAKDYRVTILDALTYAGHMENLQEILRPGQCEFVKADLRDFNALQKLLGELFLSKSNEPNSGKIAESDFNGNLMVLDNHIRIDNSVDMAELRGEVLAINPILVIFDTFGSLIGNTMKIAIAM